MNKEFKRMMELAGLTEIKVLPPRGYTLIGPDLQEEIPGMITIMKGNKEQILDYVVNNIAPTIGYEIQNDGTVIDVVDGEEMFSNVEEFREYIWDQMLNQGGFGFVGEEFTVENYLK
jgi:hypothetical protein